MSLITLPAQFVPRACQLTLASNQRVAASPFGGSEQAIDLLNDRWLLSCELPAAHRLNSAWRGGFIGAMRGQVNSVNLWHFAHPQPGGTVRGSLTLAANAAQGAASITVSGCSPANGTLLAGDMLGVGGLLLMVASDCTATGGSITVPLANRLRAAKSAGTAVVWDKPTAPFRLLSTNGVHYAPGVSDPVSFDFGEAIP
jgi:hypothetical protein